MLTSHDVYDITKNVMRRKLVKKNLDIKKMKSLYYFYC